MLGGFAANADPHAGKYSGIIVAPDFSIHRVKFALKVVADFSHERGLGLHLSQPAAYLRLIPCVKVFEAVSK